jgi:hypothetical protein
MSLSNLNEEPVIVDDESYSKLISALDQALASIENCTVPIASKAQEFKRQIENGNVPSCDESDPVVHEIIKAWVNMNRENLNVIFTEVKWFKRGK